ATRLTLGLQLTRDEILDHSPGAVRLWPFFGHPLVLGAFKYLELHFAARRLVRSDELFLNLRQHVIVERPRHDQERREADLLVPVEDLLRIGLVDGLPRLEEEHVVFHHPFAVVSLGILTPRERIAYWRAHRRVSDRGVSMRRFGEGNCVITRIVRPHDQKFGDMASARTAV